MSRNTPFDSHHHDESTDKPKNAGLSGDTEYDFNIYVNEMVSKSNDDIEKFEAGRIRNYLANWKNITTDPYLLLIVKYGYKLEFNGDPPFQTKRPLPINFSTEERKIVDAEITKLLKKKVILESFPEKGEFVSRIFLRPKRDLTFRMILDLSRLNRHLEYHHFKMEGLKTVKDLITPGCYMSTIDIKDAYYSVPIHRDFQKYLKFEWQGKLYKYTCFPNGLGPCPRIWTKLLKPVMAHLRQIGIPSVVYIDDLWMKQDIKLECMKSAMTAGTTLSDNGLIPHPVKSGLPPEQTKEFIGFIFDSINMTVSLPSHKKERLVNMCTKLLRKQSITIRMLAEVIGTLVSSFPGVMYGPLFYRQLEDNKSQALKSNHGDFCQKTDLTNGSKTELEWWIKNIKDAKNPISHGQPDIVLFSDASKLGYGYTDKQRNLSGGGKWKPDECELHINSLELLGAFFGLKALCPNECNKHVRLMIDNTTAVCYIREMGGSKSMQCNKIAHDIWEWAMERNIWLSAQHVAGVNNVDADFRSRHFKENHEWMLNPYIFKSIVRSLEFKVEIDLFATRLNAQVGTYVAWEPDPGAWAIDAMCLDWSNLRFYAFPPFSLLTRCLQKVCLERATGIIIAPNWPTQPWYPVLKSLCVRSPKVINKGKNILILPSYPRKQHPLHQKLELLACLVSGRKT